MYYIPSLRATWTPIASVKYSDFGADKLFLSGGAGSVEIHRFSVDT